MLLDTEDCIFIVNGLAEGWWWCFFVSLLPFSLLCPLVGFAFNFILLLPWPRGVKGVTASGGLYD